MGTRSVTTIEGEDGPLLKIYKQYDGYVEGGLGEELVDFLRGRKVVNGYTMQDKEDRAFNGLGCLAADVVAHLKSELGDVMWYVAQGCLALGTNIEELIDINTAKLKDRYPGGFDEFRSDNRDEDDI
mgnify:CR=1 FL=1